MIGQPDPKCRWCKGTGQVVLLVSSCDCDCIQLTFTDLLGHQKAKIANSLGIPLKNFSFKYTTKFSDEILKIRKKMSSFKQYPKPINSQGVKE